MTLLSITKVTEIYRTAAKCRITRHQIEHSTLAAFSCALRNLIRSLETDANDEFWQRTLRPIRRLGYTFCSTPLPFSEAATLVGVDWYKLRLDLRLCEKLFPDEHEALASLVKQLEELSAETNSPYIATLEKILEQDGELGVILGNTRMNQPVAEFIARTKTLRNAKVLSPSQLSGGHMCNMLATIGPCGWFPEHVFMAPRAAAVHVISPRWIRDSWQPAPIFSDITGDTGSGNRSHRIGAMPKVNEPTSTDSPSPTDLFPVDLLPPMPAFDGYGRHFAGQTGTNEDTVSARLCHLSGDRAVFIAVDDGSTSLIIDISVIGHASVRRAPTRELEPGHYLLLRTEGGGDFIAPLADRIMGKLAEKRRSEQAEWKQRFIAAAIEQFGSAGRRELSHRVSKVLRSQNLSKAGPANVHYWMSSKSIRPREIEDFFAILKFAGLEERSQDLWTAMGEIDRAHRRAGHAIRRMLLKNIAADPLELLERDGEMVFELGDEDGGTLSAFQITGISGRDYEVPADRIGVLLGMED